MATDERDQQFERALARHLRESSVDSGCPDPEALAAYHDRSLSLDEMARWKEHIVSCARCQETLALVEKSEHVHAESWEDEKVKAPTQRLPMPATARAAETRTRQANSEPSPEMTLKALQGSKAKARRAGQPLRWAVPLGALAAAMIIWVGIRERDSQRTRLNDSVQIAKNQPAPRGVPSSPPEMTPQSSEQPRAKKALDEENIAKKVAPPSQVTKSPHADASANRPSEYKKELDREESRQKDIGIFAGNIRTVKPPEQESNEFAQRAAPSAPMPSAGVVGGVGIQDEKKQAESRNAPRMQLQKQDQQLYGKQIGAARGRLAGQVTDGSGAAVAGASVRLLDDKGATVASTEADSNGNYSFSALSAGQYELEFQQAGFKRKRIEQLNVSPGDNRVNGLLQVGAATETVVVEAAAPAVNSDSANLSSTSEVTPVVSELAAGHREFMKLIKTDRRYIVAPGDKEAWRVGDQGIISRTTNSGKTWKAQQSGVRADLSAGSAPSGKVCWVVGKGGTVLLTIDGGKHWRQLASPTTADLVQVAATDALNAKVSDVSGQIGYKTSNGGQTWVAAKP